jgi:hypothetical protein
MDDTWTSSRLAKACAANGGWSVRGDAWPCHTPCGMLHIVMASTGHDVRVHHQKSPKQMMHDATTLV